MSFASEKLYNGYLRRNMPAIVTRVKVREIMIHLPCLTAHDRENIEAKREVCGNYDGMVLLLDCLKRRENWPEQFIEALEACEQTNLAAEIRAEYDTLRGTNNSNPSSPPTTVVRAHVHPAPSASPLSVPQSGANSQAAAAAAAAAVVPPPAEAAAPVEPAAQASPPPKIPVQSQSPPSAEARAPEVVSPPQPTRGEVEPPPSTPPPSPETPNTQATTTPQTESNSHQEPVENSESDIQEVSGDDAALPDQVSPGNSEVLIDTEAPPQPPPPIEELETASPSVQDSVEATTTTSTEISPPQSPSPSQMNSDVTDGSSFLMLTPEKPPVQDSTPPVDIKPTPVLLPEMSGPPATQVMESSPQTETEATSSPLPGAAEMDPSIFDDSSVSLGKPEPLLSICPQKGVIPAFPEQREQVQPYSGNSQRLEISNAAPEAVTSPSLPTCSTSVNTALPCQENGIASNHSEPEENHYESPCESLDMQEVRENVVHISEEPSILDLDGQNSIPHAQIMNSDAAKEIPPAPQLSPNTLDTGLSVNTPSGENCHPSEPTRPDTSPEPKTLPNSEKKSNNTKYILTAAGVGACALLMAWRFKN
ncbi:hypothetical protein PBY51_010984 [Eleginops maclovinus]|uniref:Mitochondrial antiviral-signaling protein n=1 Tax=Eleginops maclovinus TaxID=56733 RepID=A0AAN7X7I3_ELEMC|nr:hypothetical protein PBY51_010984 [Eleginops maclovinus]